MPNEPVDDDDDFATAIEFIVDARCHGRPIDNERSYRQAVRREAIDLDGPLVRRELARSHGPEQAARCVLGAWPSDKPTSTPVAWCPPDCPTCDGTAFVDTGNGYAPCPERTAA